ncbi:hypothetical protein BIV25_13410 [Streptomyces sp. MUSC 14]|uniref:hypothetical protein n=1 Tax=Streptomyces sp. MUSC 14 TaxID=1354889 RepID=UPI0008F5F6E1|nr:hypothetical protein [Streptomyces sp. MUSC 14]OIJ97799.1 hypothetical protein BIV25_13410 [Streptomyces sp. MUSC 14]
MTPGIPNQLDDLARRREDLFAELRRIRKAHCLAVLDHITAKVRRVCPQAAYIEFAYQGETRDVGLRGVLGEQGSPLGGLPWLWESGDEEHALAELAVEIEADVQTSLEPYDSPAWATVRRNAASEGNGWLIELPPSDRVARIAQLVRATHPEAGAVVVDRRHAGGRVIEVIEGAAGVIGRCTRPRWTREGDYALTRWVAQIFAIPVLAERHLRPVPGGYAHPYGSSVTTLVRLLPLPLPPIT